MHIGTQFSVFLINKPGVLAQTLDALARQKINIVALTMVDSAEHGVLRLVTNQLAQTRSTLQQLNALANETEVLCINLSNRAGALADITRRLAQAHININYAYCTAGARGGRTTGILKVADTKKAIKILEKAAPGPKTSASDAKMKNTRRPSPSRRRH